MPGLKATVLYPDFIVAEVVVTVNSPAAFSLRNSAQNV
jgi:hypothetical protein